MLSLPGRLEETDQLLGHGLGCEHRGEMAGARQLADLRVGDVLGDMPCLIGGEADRGADSSSRRLNDGYGC